MDPLGDMELEMEVGLGMEMEMEMEMSGSGSGSGSETRSGEEMQAAAAVTSGGEAVGEFVLGRTLGVGATGKVKLGTHRVTGLQVAIKIISKETLEAKPGMRKKMEREIAVLRLVNHPNVMKLFDVYETSRYLFLVLEYVQGGELFDHLVRKGRLLPDEALRFFQQIIHGVEYCHKHMVCHRDLKPENLLLDENGNVKLADFGMASIMKSNSLLETSCGSPHYACPEVVTGQPYSGEAADIWSVGVILYALLTGRLPFDDNNIRRLLKKVRAGRYLIPNWVSADIKDLISRMLTVDPERRISIAQIKAHPWFNSLPYDAPPVRPVSDAITSALPVQSPDPDIVASLVALGWGTTESLHVDLASEQKAVAKVFYHLLAERKSELASAPLATSATSASAAPTPSPALPMRTGGHHDDDDDTSYGRLAASYAPSPVVHMDMGASNDTQTSSSSVATTSESSEMDHVSPAYPPRQTPVGGTGTTGARMMYPPPSSSSQAVPLSQSVPTSNAYALAASAGMPIPMDAAPPSGYGYNPSGEASGAGGVAGTPRFHRHAYAAPLAVAASPPVSASPHVSWFSGILGPGSSTTSSAANSDLELEAAAGGSASAAAAASAAVASAVMGTSSTSSSSATTAPSSPVKGKSSIQAQIDVNFYNTTPKALGTKVALALHGARCKFRRNSFYGFKAKCNYGGVILKFKIVVSETAVSDPSMASCVPVSFLLQSGLPESFASLVDQLSADMRALQQPK